MGYDPPSRRRDVEKRIGEMSDQDKLHTWELISKRNESPRVFRMKVPGGWLYRCSADDKLTYVPEPEPFHDTGVR